MINEVNVAVPPPNMASLARQYSPSPNAERIWSTVAGDSTDKSNVLGIAANATDIGPAARLSWQTWRNRSDGHASVRSLTDGQTTSIG
jgi:hypothetical protein